LSGSTVTVTGPGIPEGARVIGVSTNSTSVYITAPIGVATTAQALPSPVVFRGGGTLVPIAGAVAKSFTLSGGADGALASITGATAIALLADAETVDVNLLFCSEAPDQVGVTEQSLIQTAVTRKDCVAFISAPLTVKDQTSEANKLAKCTNGASGKFDMITRSSYVVFDSGPLYVYNKYQDNYAWIPASGHIAGLCASTDTVAEPWFSPAGYQRGQLLGTTKLGFNPNQASRDTLYKAGINPIVTFPGQGTILFGDKTGQAKPSAFDRINVRRLFIVLEKAIATAAKYQLFELNDSFTQAMFRNMVEPYLRDIKGRRGITDFLVVCDSTNNTGAVVDSNQFVADIYIKPARSINFITLNFIATRTGVSFSEIVGTKNQ
jgi:phage tail sheath protein FI